MSATTAGSSVIVEGLINGVDLCYLQGNVNFQKMRDAGFEYVYVKSSQYSKTRDFSFDKYAEQAQKAGLWCGAYHFCAHDTDPVAQAEFFFKASSGLGKTPGELPPMIDWEFCTASHYVPPKYPLGHPRHCVDWLEKFVKRVRELWFPNDGMWKEPRSPVVYTYPDYANRHQPVLAASSVGSLPLCYASYKGVKDPSQKTGYRLVPWLPKPSELPLHKVPLPWTKATLVQYSGNNGLKVPGVIPDCDRQVFLGSRADFDRFRGIRPATSSEVSSDGSNGGNVGGSENGSPGKCPTCGK